MSKAYAWPALPDLLNQGNVKRQIFSLARKYNVEVHAIRSALVVVHHDCQARFDAARGVEPLAYVMSTLRIVVDAEFMGVVGMAARHEQLLEEAVQELHTPAPWLALADAEVDIAVARLAGPAKAVAQLALQGLGSREIAAALGRTQRRVNQLIDEAERTLATFASADRAPQQLALGV